MKEIFTRASIRRYEDRPVEKEKIEQILRAAMAAPSAMNQRPWEFYVVTDKGKLMELSKSSPYTGMTANAPCAIVVCYRGEGIPVPSMAEIDCSLATENMLLEIEHLGLGGVMLGIAPIEERMAYVEKVIGAPENVKVFTIIPFGYPAEKRDRKDRYEKDRVHVLA